MRYKIFSNSYKTWEAMFAAIAAADKSVCLETYIFLDDLHNFNFLQLLIAKARAGVKVKIILDAFGSLRLPKAAVENLRSAGAEVFFYSHLLHRIHRKILVVDENIAFIGGVNIHQIARNWDDLTIRIDGGYLVRALLRSFSKVYAECGGKDPAVLVHKKMVLHRTRTFIIEHFPARRKPSLKKIYLEALRGAHENIVLVTPYLAPRRWFLRALHQAVLRGVRVEVLMPRTGNHFLGNILGEFFMRELSEQGVIFYLEPKMNHAKGMLVDRKTAVVGSHNLDFFSFELNSELGLFIEDPELVREFASIVDRWRSQAIKFDPESVKTRPLGGIVGFLVRLFSKIF